MPYLFRVARGKEKKVVEVFGQHGGLAKKARAMGYPTQIFIISDNERRHMYLHGTDLDTVISMLQTIDTVIARSSKLKEDTVLDEMEKHGGGIADLAHQMRSFRSILAKIDRSKMGDPKAN